MPNNPSHDRALRERLLAGLAATHPEPPRPLASRDLPGAAGTKLDESFLRDLRPAAVLVAVMERPHGLTVLFTRRSSRLRAHAGQVSFPGGRREAADEGPAATALRESHEEVGMDTSRVRLVGYLDDYPTITRFLVTPVVGLVSGDAVITPDRVEVDEVFEVPLGFLLDARNYQRRTVVRGGRQVPYWALSHGGHVIWGATAGMLRNLLDKLG